MMTERHEQLAAEFLRKLATADMKAWRAHQRAAERGGKDDALSSRQAQKIEPHAQPPKPRAPHVVSEAGREKREAQRQRIVKLLGGKPTSPARAAAIAAGSKTYKRPKPCKRCGGNLYYVISQNCIGCHKVANAKRAEKERPNEKELRALL